MHKLVLFFVIVLLPFFIHSDFLWAIYLHLFFIVWLFLSLLFHLCISIHVLTTRPLRATGGGSLSLRCTLYRLLFCALVEVFFFPVASL